MRKTLLLFTVFTAFFKMSNAQLQPVVGSVLHVADSWNNVVSSGDQGNYYHLIGTYQGWDKKAVYIAGYNKNVHDLVTTEKVVIGNHSIDNNFLLVNLMTGNVGIGDTAPRQKLQIGNNFLHSSSTPDAISLGASYSDIAGRNAKLRLWDDGGGVYYGVGVSANQFDFMIPTSARYVWSINGSEKMRLLTNGSLGIGTTTTGSMMLAVEGNIGARKVIVTQANPFPDYVFKKDYKLRSLTDVEDFIKTYSHLPEIPSAKEVEKDGLDLGATQAALLKKIEELTLYIIEQGKELKNQNKEILNQNKKISLLQRQIEKTIKR